jgi:drug/metabolite transporter (DMT)-like permease
MTSYVRSILLLLLGATLISFSPVFVKLAVNAGLGPTAVGFWRLILGSLILFGIASFQRKPLKLPRRALVYALLAGFAFLFDIFFWHRSIIYAGSGMATMLANTQVFATAVISFFVFRERPGLTFVFAAIAGMAGVALMVGIGSEEVVLEGTYLRGVIFGLITGISYANYIVCLKKGQMAAERPDPVVFTAWAALFSAIFLGLVGAFEPDKFFPTKLIEIVSVFGLAIFVQALGWLVITRALPSVVTAHAGLILLLQPTLAMIWGVLFFAELLTPLQVVGALVTLLAMYVGSVRRKAKVLPQD